VFESLKWVEMRLRAELRPGPGWGANSAPPDFL